MSPWDAGCLQVCWLSPWGAWCPQGVLGVPRGAGCPQGVLGAAGGAGCPQGVLGVPRCAGCLHGALGVPREYWLSPGVMTVPRGADCPQVSAGRPHQRDVKPLPVFDQGTRGTARPPRCPGAVGHSRHLGVPPHRRQHHPGKALEPPERPSWGPAPPVRIPHLPPGQLIPLLNLFAPFCVTTPAQPVPCCPRSGSSPSPGQPAPGGPRIFWGSSLHPPPPPSTSHGHDGPRGRILGAPAPNPAPWGIKEPHGHMSPLPTDPPPVPVPAPFSPQDSAPTGDKSLWVPGGSSAAQSRRGCLAGESVERFQQRVTATGPSPPKPTKTRSLPAAFICITSVRNWGPAALGGGREGRTGVCRGEGSPGDTNPSPSPLPLTSLSSRL